MLTHKVLGPDAAGKYSVGYPTPGTSTYTVVCDGCTQAAALAEATRRNLQQQAVDQSILDERAACGLRSAGKARKGRS